MIELISMIFLVATSIFIIFILITCCILILNMWIPEVIDLVKDKLYKKCNIEPKENKKW